MEVGAASTTGYTPPQDIEAGLDPAVQQDAQQQNAAPSQEDAAAPPRGNSLPPDSAIHPSIATQLMQGVVNGAKEMANTVRADDEKKQQFGAWIDSGEQYIEGKIDQGRAWLRENGGTVGQKAADQIGLAEGVAISVYDTGKGLVQLADGAASLSSVREWIANPQANIARLKTVASSAETLGKLALLTNPATAQAAWMADPQGNAQLAGALWNSAATSFNKDPAKFTGNVVGTVAMMAVPVGGEAAIVGDLGRGTVLVSDASRIAEGADIAANINKAKTLAEVGNLAKPEPVIAEGANAAANAAKGEQNTAKVGEAVAGLKQEAGAGAERGALEQANGKTPNVSNTGKLIGSIDNLTPAEQAFVRELVASGKTVEIIPTAAGRTADFLIDGVRHELKTLSGVVNQTSDGLSSALSNRIMNARGQSGNIIVDARGQAGMTREIAERGINRAFGRDNGIGSKIQSITVMTPQGTVYIPRMP